MIAHHCFVLMSYPNHDLVWLISLGPGTPLEGGTRWTPIAHSDGAQWTSSIQRLGKRDQTEPQFSTTCLGLTLQKGPYTLVQSCLAEHILISC